MAFPWRWRPLGELSLGAVLSSHAVRKPHRVYAVRHVQRLFRNADGAYYTDVQRELHAEPLRRYEAAQRFGAAATLIERQGIVLVPSASSFKTALRALPSNHELSEHVPMSDVCVGDVLRYLDNELYEALGYEHSWYADYGQDCQVYPLLRLKHLTNSAEVRAPLDAHTFQNHGIVPACELPDLPSHPDSLPLPSSSCA